MTKQQFERAQTQDVSQVVYWLKVLCKRWRIVWFSCFAGVAAAVAVHLLMQPKFESIAMLLVMRKDARLAAKGVEPGIETEAKVTEEVLATHMQMLQSRSIVEGALKDAGLSELPSIIDHLGPNEKPAEHVINNLTVSRGGKGQARMAHVLNVAYRNPSDVDSEAVLRAIVKKYQSFLSTEFQDVNQEAATLISDVQNKLADELQQAERDFEKFRQESANLMWKYNEGTTNPYRTHYDGVMQEIATLKLALADSTARLDAVNERLKGGKLGNLSELELLSLIDEKNLTRIQLLLMVQKGEVDSPDFQSEQPIRLAHATAEVQNFAELQLKEKTLLTELGPRHPEIVGIRHQIESLEEFLQSQRKDLKSGKSGLALDTNSLFEAYCDLLKNDISAMERRQERLMVLADETLQQATKMVTAEIQGDTLRRTVERKQELYDAAVDRLREINLAKDYGGFINEVLSEPELGIKVSPRLRNSVALGGFVMMLLCFAGVGIAEYRDRRFRTVDDLRSSLQLPIFGRIPVVKPRTRRGGSLFSRGSGANYSHLFDPNSPGADAFRRLRTSRVFADGDDFRQILCCTSSNAGDGKSTLVGNLAVSLGQLGRRVLVIDCDLRRPTQHNVFDVPCEHGLTTLLQSELDSADFIQSTTQKNVYVLTRGEAVPDPAEFLGSGKFNQLLDSLRDKYDHILLDCPPILPVVDALTPAALADGVIVLIRMERTTQMQAQAMCTALRHSGANVDGVVVIGNTEDGFYGDEYRYDYGYGYEDKSKNTNPLAPNRLNGGSRIAMTTHRNGTSTMLPD